MTDDSTRDQANTPPSQPNPTLQILEGLSPTFDIIGDADGTRPEHAVEMVRLLGGGVFGDIAGLSKARLAILPGTTHFGLMQPANWLIPMLTEFLDEAE